MDENQFDALTAAIGTAPTRRGVFRALLGGALAMVGADTLAQELGVEGNAGDGDKCKQNNDCGKGLFCKKIKKKKKRWRFPPGKFAAWHGSCGKGRGAPAERRARSGHRLRRRGKNALAHEPSMRRAEDRLPEVNQKGHSHVMEVNAADSRGAGGAATSVERMERPFEIRGTCHSSPCRFVMRFSTISEEI